MSILITENPNRFVLYPIQYPKLFEFYKKHIASFWTVEEIDMSQDTMDWQKLTETEREFILCILGFFSASDGIVVENLVTNFCAEVQLPEARAMYSFQAAMENIHSETYSLMIDTLATNQQKELLFNHIDNHPGTKAKAEWAMKYMEAKRGCVTNFSERLVAFACVEGIMFSSSFCALYWLKNRGLCPGLTFSNELISRDEGLHRDFAVAMYKICPKLSRKRILDIIQSAVEVEMKFVKHSLPENLKGMNYDMMTQYVQFVADHLLNSLGYNKLYKVKNPFPFMDMISLEGKTNFFERRVGEYSRPTAMSFGMDDAF
jgi:ribonucleoside-diphosphate reductase beta chain